MRKVEKISDKILKMTEKVSRIGLSRLHELSFVSKINNKYYQCYFYYKDNNPVKPRANVTRFFENLKRVIVEINGVPTGGVLCYSNQTLQEGTFDISLLKDFQLPKKLEMDSFTPLEFLPNGEEHIKTSVKVDGKNYNCLLYFEIEFSNNPTSSISYEYSKISKCTLEIEDNKYFDVLCLLGKEITDDSLIPSNSNNYKISDFKDVSHETIDFLHGKKMEELLSYVNVDYPQFPFKDFVVKSQKDAMDSFSYEDIMSFYNDINNFPLPDDKKYLSLIGIILNDTLNFVKNDCSDPDFYLSKFVSFWKKYCLEKMDEIMEETKKVKYDKDSISGSPYLSIESLKKHKDFKYNWKLVTSNPAISDRDILMNPDLFPWDEESLIMERSLPLKFYKYKEIRPPSYYFENPTTPREYNKIELLLSPGELPEYLNISDEVNVDENEIKEAFDLLQKEYPEFFDEVSVNFLDSVKKSIIENISVNGVFILDEFTFPNQNISEDKAFDDFFPKKDEKAKILEPTEDDPYGVREIISKIKSKKDPYMENATLYEKIIGLNPSLVTTLIKNRKEYIDLLTNSNVMRFDIEKCVFFELSDPYNYPKLFCDSGNIAKILCNSGKLTLEYILNNPDNKWESGYLVKCLPLDYVFKNLLFYPNRVHLKYLKENKFPLKWSVSELNEYLLKKDKELLKLFSSREDVQKDYEYVFQYPFLNWYVNSWRNDYFNVIPPQLIGFLKEENNKFKEDKKLELDNFKRLTDWDSLCSHEGIRILLQYLNKETKLPSNLESIEERERFVTNVIKKDNELMETFSGIVPLRIKEKNKSSLWIFSPYINYESISKAYYREFGSYNLFSLFLVLLNVLGYDYFQNKREITIDFLYEYIKYKLSLCKTIEERSNVYNYLCCITGILIKSLSTKDLYGLEFSRPYLKLSNDFTLEDISYSKFKSYSIVLSDILHKLKDENNNSLLQKQF